MNLGNIFHFLGGSAAAVLERTLTVEHKGAMTLKSTENNAINISVAPRNIQSRFTKYLSKEKLSEFPVKVPNSTHSLSRLLRHYFFQFLKILDFLI